MRRLASGSMMFGLIATCLLMPAARAASYPVVSTGDAHDARPGDRRCAAATGECTLRAAIEEANASPGGDTITFRLRHRSTIVLTLGQLEIAPAGALRIQGPGADSLSLDGNAASRLLHVSPDATAEISGLTLRNGYVDQTELGDPMFGGGLENVGTLTLRNVVISGNRAPAGGGGILNAGTLNLVRTTVSGNSAVSFAGGILNSGSMLLFDCLVGNNDASDGAGGIDNRGTATLTNSVVSGNTSRNHAAGIDSRDTLNLIESTIRGNTGIDGVGGIENFGTLNLFGSAVTGNRSNVGGGIAGTCGAIAVSGSLIAGNSGNTGPQDPHADCILTHLSNFQSNGPNVFGQGTGCAPGAVDGLALPGFDRGDAAAVWPDALASPAVVAAPVDVRVAASTDDAEESASGDVSLTSTDLELVYDGSKQQTVGMRFNGVAVPRSATITGAWVQFAVDEAQSEATSLLIQGQAIDNAPTFSSPTGDVSTRTRTTASVPWTPIPWSTIGQAGLDQRTPDLAAVVQQIVNRSGWSSGNSLVILITGTGHRTASAYDGEPAAAPLLHVEFQTSPPVNTAPVVNAGPDQTITLPSGASLAGTAPDDGLPSPPAAVTCAWTTTSGPDQAVFANASSKTTTATFPATGGYVLRLTCNDSVLEAFDEVSITANPVPVDNPPTAVLSLTTLASPPLTVKADATGSTDADATPIASYTFTFGDGSAAVTTTPPTVTAQHTYASAGPFTVTLTATDTAGKISSPVTKSVTFSNAAPVVNAGPDQTINLPAGAALAGTMTDDGLPIPPGTVTCAWTTTSGPAQAVFVNPASKTTTATFPASGAYVLRLTCNDGALQTSDEAAFTVNSIVIVTKEVRVAASSDDAEESSSGSVSLSSGDLELVYDSGNQKVGMRFNSLAVPRNSTITSAWVQFTAKETQSEATSLQIQGQAIDTAPTFSSSSSSISARTRTIASVPWTPLAWGTVGQAGLDQRTPDLKAVVQEIVSRTGWSSGNSLVILITGTGHRTAYSYDGSSSSAPLLHIEFDTSTAVNSAPVVNAGPNQTITLPSGASLAGTATDDGLPSPPGVSTCVWTRTSGPAQTTFANANSKTTTATFPTNGTYVLRLTCDDSVLQAFDEVSITVNPVPVDNPPVAALSVTTLASPPLTVKADASGSTDTDATPIATYKFTFGDSTSAVTTTAPTATAQHTYASAGTYTVTLTATDTGGKVSSPVTKSVSVSSGSGSGSSIAVYVGYYDTHHANTKTKPNPWKGSSGVVFVGTADSAADGGGWDTSTVRVDNLSSSTLSGVVVTVDIGSHHYAYWGTNSIPAGGKLIVAQTGFENFDGSDLNTAGCYSCSADLCTTAVSSTKPVVHVTAGGQTYNVTDSGQVLNTKGVDSAGCPYTGTRNDEAQNWIQIK